MELFEFIFRLAVAILLGAAIGFERQYRQRSASLRTNGKSRRQAHRAPGRNLCGQGSSTTGNGLINVQMCRCADWNQQTIQQFNN